MEMCIRDSPRQDHHHNAMLHNWVMLEAIREDHPKERIVMVILPGAGGELLTEAGSRDIFEDVYDEMEADLVADGELLLHYDKSDVIETDRTRYLLGAAEVSEIDQNGNECSINLFTLERTIDYVNENLTVVSIGGELGPALRLKICRRDSFRVLHIAVVVKFHVAASRPFHQRTVESGALYPVYG